MYHSLRAENQVGKQMIFPPANFLLPFVVMMASHSWLCSLHGALDSVSPKYTEVVVNISILDEHLFDKQRCPPESSHLVTSEEASPFTLPSLSSDHFLALFLHFNPSLKLKYSKKRTRRKPLHYEY